MKPELFNEAKRLNDLIKQCEYDIKILNEQEYSAIRFRGQFNVSSPIMVSEGVFMDIKMRMLGDREIDLH